MVFWRYVCGGTGRGTHGAITAHKDGHEAAPPLLHVLAVGNDEHPDHTCDHDDIGVHMRPLQPIIEEVRVEDEELQDELLDGPSSASRMRHPTGLPVGPNPA